MRVVVILALLQIASAQPAFEVASVKPADPNARTIDMYERPGGRLTITNVSLLRIVQFAYGMHWYWIQGGPGWIDKDRFDIVAKALGEASHEELMKMLQVLLEERFQVKLHRETKEGTVYHLVVGKNGAKLSPPKERDGNSFIGGKFSATTHTLVGNNASLDLLAQRLEDELRRPVIDQTGIKGNFDFTVEYNIDESKPENGPSLFSAVQEIGLKLESVKGPVEVLVIDRAEKPTEN